VKQTAGMREGDIAQIKVSLQDIEPTIWRRLEVPAEIKLSRLHVALQAAMGWQDYHLHAFRIGDIEYGVPDPDYEPMGVPLKDDRRATLRSLVGVGESFVYEYDFGDGWEHEILVEAVLAPRPRTRYPRVIDGARACPPEDVGGTPGYEGFLEAVADPRHEEHDSMLEWAGGSFDAEAFDMDAANRELDIRFR
jgi:hypothetical protein